MLISGLKLSEIFKLRLWETVDTCNGVVYLVNGQLRHFNNGLESLSYNM